LTNLITRNLLTMARNCCGHIIQTNRIRRQRSTFGDVMATQPRLKVTKLSQHASISMAYRELDAVGMPSATVIFVLPGDTAITELAIRLRQQQAVEGQPAAWRG